MTLAGTEVVATPSRLVAARYFVFGKLCPAVVYVLVGWFTLRRAISSFQDLGSHPSLNALIFDPPYPIYLCVYGAFFSIIAVIYVVRPMPRARAGGAMPRVFAFAGTAMLGVFGVYFDTGPLIAGLPKFVHDAASVLLLASTGFATYGLVYLRMSFSIVPEARRLVRGGPYRLVRHPLYLGEIGAAISAVLQSDLRLWTTLELVPFVAVQFGRSVFEERLLRNAFPDYVDYADHTRRLVPFLW